MSSGCTVFSTEGMKNGMLRQLAVNWNEGLAGKKDVLLACKYDSGYRGPLNFRDVVFLLQVLSGERYLRAVQVFPVVSGGRVYEIFLFLDGTPPKGYVSLHVTLVGQDETRCLMRFGWRDFQENAVLGEFSMDAELRDIVSGVYVLDGGDVGLGQFTGYRVSDSCEGYTSRGLPVFSRVESVERCVHSIGFDPLESLVLAMEWFDGG